MGFLAMLLLGGCGRLDTLVTTQTPEQFCTVQWCADWALFGRELVILEPSSTVIVYALGVLTLLVGARFLRMQQGQQSRRWWGVALLLWGVGALMAGTSYENLGYELKCAGRPLCLFTTWWEVGYLWLSALSIDAMAAAMAWSSATGSARRWILRWAGLNAALYTVATVVGALVPVKALITFTTLLVAAAPNLLLFYVLAGLGYHRYRDTEDRRLLIAWIWLLVVMIAYVVYNALGITAILWQDGAGIWFSEDDVLHLGLMTWMGYLGWRLAPVIVDKPAEDSAAAA